MTRPSTDHVAFHAADHEFRCGHCGDFTGIADGSTVTASVARLQGFALMHRHCPKPVEPSRQMALPGTEPAPKQGLSTFSMSELDAVDASTSDPAPEIDPPGPEPWAHKYPMARDHAALRGHLLVALSNSGLNTPTVEQLQQWAHPATGIFDAAAHWARIQVAALNETEDRKHDPSWIGPRERPPMPEKLRELIEGEAPKKKRRRK